MKFSVGDKVLFKKDNLKGEVLKINSLFKLTVLTSDGFELNISEKDIVIIEDGTDKISSYGDKFYSKDSNYNLPKSLKNQRSKSILKIDLHIELLISNSQYMSNFDIVQIQLNECHKKIEKCLNSNITKLEIIHGVGQGILKNEVHNILRNYNFRYYLSKDGGSTEVFI